MKRKTRDIMRSLTTSLLLKLGLFLLLFTSAVECQYESEITWTISKTSSCEDEQQLGCRCETSLLKPKPLTKITCSCNDVTQVVNLKGLRSKKPPVQIHEVTWSIENCNNVTVHSKVLPPSGAGADFNLEFVNISSLSLQEDAFENVASSTSTLNTPNKAIRFYKCNMENIPAKSFPSNLKSIEFVECFIGRIKSNSFKQLYMNSLIFDNTTIEDMEPNAFYQDLDYWIAKGSRFKRIQTNSLTGGIRHMNWSNCQIDDLETNAINAVIVNSRFESSVFTRIDPNGLTIKDWTSFSLINNTFHRVNYSAIDLTQRSSSTDELALIKGNTWLQPTPNFILTGQMQSVMASVENNTFGELCECGKTFAALITIDSSKEWFVQEVLKNSRCPITQKVTSCLERNETFLFYDELDLLCEVYACTRELQAVSEIFEKQSTDHLRILAIFIGTLAGAIVVSLLVTFCVFLLRRRTGGSKRNETSDITKSLGGPQDYSSSSDVPRYKIPHHNNHNNPHLPPPPSLRPRSTLFEDVEMEDKGVQTMPSELSTDVLESLREKLSRPDSFWDAKSEIDHLYGLIQVREQSASNQALSTSSPPDVTMCNNMMMTPTTSPNHNNSSNSNINSVGSRTLNSSSNSNNKGGPSPPSLFLPPSSSSSSSLSMSMSKSNSNSIPPSTSNLSNLSNTSTASMGLAPIMSKDILLSKRYAQIRPKPKTATLCEYRDPSDSQVHIYSELSHHPPPHPSSSTLNPHLNSTFNNPSMTNRPRPPVTKHGIIGLPVLCEYNEPKDATAHVYAELASIQTNNLNATSPSSSSFSPMTTLPSSQSQNVLITTPTTTAAATTPDQKEMMGVGTAAINKGIAVMTPSLNHSSNPLSFQNSNTHKRPLPAIPSSFSSSSSSSVQ